MTTLTMPTRIPSSAKISAGIALRRRSRKAATLHTGRAGYFIASMVSLVGLANSAHAEDIFSAALKQAKEPQLWKNFGGISHHFKNPERFNQENTGFGIEYTIDRSRSLVVGQYLNSVNFPTRYVGGAWAPLQYGPVKMGVVAGLADGYPMMNGGSFFPMLLPLIAIETHNVGVNFTLIPSVAAKGSGCVAMQLKFRYR